MARLPRLTMPGCPHHIIQRGNNKQPCFFQPSDYKAYLSFLQEASEQYGVSIHAFVLMTNHVHILATPCDTKGISAMMQALGRRYVQHINYVYERSGTLWEGRFRSTLVDSERYLMTLYRYIELNPVRAGMVARAGDYPWSSFQHNAIGKPIKLIRPHPVYQQLGDSAEERRRLYGTLFKGLIPDQEIAAIRHATNKSWPLGSDTFIADLAAKTQRRVSPLGRGGDRKSEKFRDSQNQPL